MNRKKKNIIGLLARLVTVFVILGIVATKIDFKETALIIAHASPFFFLASFGLFMMNRILTAIKWDILLRSNNIRAGLPALIRITLESSFLGFVIPSGIDIVRLVQLGNKERNLTASTSSIMADRMLAAAALGLLSIFASALGWQLVDDKTVLLIVMAAGLMLVLAVLTVMSKISFRVYSIIHDALFKIAGQSGHPVSTRIKMKAEEIHGAFTIVLKNPYVLLASLGMNILVQLIRVIQVHLLFKAGGMNVPLIFQIAFVPIITLIAMTTPFMGVGCKEAAFLFFFGRIGVSRELSVAVSLLSYLIAIASLIPGAILFFAGPKRDKVTDDDKEAINSDE